MVRVQFYKQKILRGCWEPIDKLVKLIQEDFEFNNDFKKDLSNVVVFIIAQIAAMVLPAFLVMLK